MLSMEQICADLQDELADLDRILVTLSPADWNRPTPAPGWSIRDQVSHIGGTDRVATIAAGDPEHFISDILTQERGERQRQQMEIGRQIPQTALLDWWRAGWQPMLDVFCRLDPTSRVPWFGPAMSAVSFATARLMETWAHGQDIVDTLGVHRPVTERLQHIAHIGVRARPFSYTTRALTPPAENVRVELRSPAGALWTWGDTTASHRVSGTALDFCLIVIQRRHLADTNLQLDGALAQEWMSMAQAFAGPPGAGRQPGQFPPHT